MKKIVSLCAVLILCVCACVSHGYAEKLVTNGGQFNIMNTGYQEFLEDNPQITMEWSDVIYHPATLLTSALISGEFDCDLFVQGTNALNWKTLMKKGYCLDLSDSTILTDAMNRMHPQIAAQMTYDGHLYAIPVRINFMYYRIYTDTWASAGYTLADVPGSFPEFLTFLNAWCDRLEREPDLNVGIIGGWDDSSYSSSSYTQWLTELLISEYVMQMQYAGMDLSFNSEELAGYLEQIKTLGKRIYNLESRHCSAFLFENMANGMWPEKYSDIVFFRLNEQQPQLIRSALYMWAVNPMTSNSAKCIELLEKVVTGENLSGSTAAMFLYADAIPMEDPEYHNLKEYWTQQKNDVETKLAQQGLSPEYRMDLEYQLNKYNNALALVESQRWLLTEEQLADYQSAVNMLYFPEPSVFDFSADGYNSLYEKIKRFASGKLSTAQFLNSLESITTMMRIESNE